MSITRFTFVPIEFSDMTPVGSASKRRLAFRHRGVRNAIMHALIRYEQYNRSNAGCALTTKYEHDTTVDKMHAPKTE